MNKSDEYMISKLNKQEYYDDEHLYWYNEDVDHEKMKHSVDEINESLLIIKTALKIEFFS